MRARLTVRGARRSAVLACAAAMAVALAVPATAGAAPTVTGLRFTAPPVIGRLATLRVTASDPAAAVAGVAVAFGGGDGLFESSACRPPDSSGRQPGGAFAPGASDTFAVPHVFRSGGARALLVAVASGGCSENGSTVVEQVTVTPTPPGAPLVPLSPPTLVAGTGVGGTTLPSLPTTAPPLPGVPTLPSLPTTLPPLPGVPTLPSVSAPPLPHTRVEAARRAPGCAFAHRTPQPRNARSLRHARTAILCLLNRERRAFRLAPLRESRRLDQAAALHDARMVRGGYFAHAEPGGLSLVQRLRFFHYITARVRWIAGENLAAGIGSGSPPDVVVRAWMNSVEHRANILDAAFRQIGIAIAPGVPGSPARGVTYTTDFGARS